MTPLQLKAALIGLVALIGISGYVVWRLGVAEKAVAAYQLHAADSTHHADSVTSVRKLDSLARANLRLDSMARAADARSARYAAARTATDTARVHLASARDSLAAVLADSQATIDALRASGQRMIQASDSAERSHLLERQAADSALHAATMAYRFAVDSVQKRATDAVNAATKRAIDAEAEVKIAKRLIPNSAVGWLKLAGTAAVAFEVGKVAAGGKLP